MKRKVFTANVRLGWTFFPVSNVRLVCQNGHGDAKSFIVSGKKFWTDENIFLNPFCLDLSEEEIDDRVLQKVHRQL